jgi:hypothetical protein
MNELIAVASILVIAVVVFGIVFFIRRRPRKLNTERFAKDWAELQQLCGDKTTWKQAVIEADNLLDLALRKKGIRGKSTGERMVKIQKQFTNNDGTWYGHKLRRQIDTEPKKRLTDKEVKNALLGIRQALKDIGALPDGGSKKS